MLFIVKKRDLSKNIYKDMITYVVTDRKRGEVGNYNRKLILDNMLAPSYKIINNVRNMPFEVFSNKYKDELYSSGPYIIDVFAGLGVLMIERNQHVVISCDEYLEKFKVSEIIGDMLATRYRIGYLEGDEFESALRDFRRSKRIPNLMSEDIKDCADQLTRMSSDFDMRQFQMDKKISAEICKTINNRNQDNNGWSFDTGYTSQTNNFNNNTFRNNEQNVYDWFDDYSENNGNRGWFNNEQESISFNKINNRPISKPIYVGDIPREQQVEPMNIKFEDDSDMEDIKLKEVVNYIFPKVSISDSIKYRNNSIKMATKKLS